jgi:hypothetical protein
VGLVPNDVQVVRPDDHVVLTFRFRNLELRGAPDRPELVPSAQPALLIVDLPLQAFADQVFDEQDGAPPATDLPPPGAAGLRPARPSRLVFVVGDGEAVAYSLEGLLEACTRLAPKLPENAPSAVMPDIFDPNVTGLELPYGLIVAPVGHVAWQHAVRPVGEGGRVELWHTRLASPGTPPGHRPQPLRRLRARWPGRDTVGDEYVTALSVSNRNDLVTYAKSGDERLYADADLLMLSSLGAWLDTHGDWDAVPGVGTLRAWTHQSTMGRDHYVRAVEAGYLFPFGHRAIKVSISQRKVQARGDAEPVAYLRKRTYVVVRQADIFYETDLEMPFRQVTLPLTATPDLFSPSHSSVAPGAGEDAFWVQVSAEQDLLFHVRAHDRGQRAVEFLASLAFVRANVGEANDPLRATFKAFVEDTANQPAGDDPGRRRRHWELAGQHVTFAVPRDPRSDSTYETVSIQCNGAWADDRTPPFRPLMERASALVPAVRHLTGSDSPVTFAWHPAYTRQASGGAVHPLDVFATLLTPPPPVRFDLHQAGGLVAPDMTPSGLSRTFGPLAGQQTLAEGTATFDPAEVFGPGPRLLGVLPLADLLGAVAVSHPDAAFPPNPGGSAVPRMVTDDQGTTHLQWVTTTFQPKNLAAEVFDGTGASLTLDVSRGTGATPAVRSTSRLENFSVSLPSKGSALIEIPFKHLAFESSSGSKPDVSVDLGTVAFRGPLAFVNELTKIIPPGGFVDPPALEVTPEGITAGFTLVVPSVGFGVFALQHLALAAGFHLPLVTTDNPRDAASVHFAFSDRDNPCMVSVEAFAGAAFLALDVGFDGLQKLEGSLEFGGAVAVSIGVASGGVSVTAGIYYAYVKGSDDSLKAFVRAVGVLEVLGIVSISAQFLLALGYVPAQNKLSGTATLTVKVKVLFVSKSVSLTVEREFAASPPPTFEQVYPTTQDWARYLSAFASET